MKQLGLTQIIRSRWRIDSKLGTLQYRAMSATPRRAAMRDLAAVEAIVEAAYSPYITVIGQKPGPMLDDYAAHIRAGHVHVVEQHGAVKAILVLVPEADAMLLDNVAVAPDAQGSGLGGVLLDFAEAAARDAGHDTIRLYTHELMTTNIEIYKRRGYVETHRATTRTGLRRVFMAKKLH